MQMLTSEYYIKQLMKSKNPLEASIAVLKYVGYIFDQSNYRLTSQ